MKIQQIELQNFRCFEEKTFEFSEQFNVIIGDNGTGKTALLRALLTGISALFSHLPGIELRDSVIDPDDIRLVKYYKNEIPTFENQFPVKVSCQGMIENQEVSWRLEIPDETTVTWPRNNAVSPLVQLVKKVKKGEDVLLPVIAYYATNRLFMPKKENDISIIQPRSRLQGYINCLNPNVKSLLAWFTTMEIASVQRGQEISVLSAVKKVIINCIENCREVKYDILGNEFIVTFNDNNELPLRMLSDGFRTMLLMVASIAYQAAVLNPQLGREAAQQTPGIVLIDEIDLHLHPKWQRQVVEDLKRTFPKIQFFATTHSEHIIQSLRAGELIDLNNPESIPEAEYENKSIEEIAENVMHVHQTHRANRYQEMMDTAELYYQMLEDANKSTPDELKKIKEKLDELIEPYSNDVAYHAFLKMKRIAALGE